MNMDEIKNEVSRMNEAEIEKLVNTISERVALSAFSKESVEEDWYDFLKTTEEDEDADYSVSEEDWIKVCSTCVGLRNREDFKRAIIKLINE